MGIEVSGPQTGRASSSWRAARLLFRAVCCSFLLLAFLCLPALAQTGAWMRQSVGSLAWLHAVFFLDENRGWAVGSRGTLLATMDGGKSWKARSQPTADVLRDIYFTDDQNGWLLCEANLYDLKSKDDPRTYLMQTNDGGQNWKRINIRGVDVDARLVRAVFSQRGRGWAFGEGGTIFTTRDSGVSWTRLQSPTRHLLLGGTFVDEDRGWLVGAGATIIQTSDGGETWHLSRLADASQKAVRFAATSFVNNRLGWAVGSGGSIYHTINGGRTWQQQVSGIVSDLFDVKFLDAVEGWAVGAEGTIIYTNDGGLHWTAERSGTEHPLERIFFADRKHGWAVGFGGTVVAYARTEAPRLSK
ncbi:MAG: YCF48-related protein [Acidobacteriota bacterium]|nr:YCF48-related protein [Acidobacteriota bacterium]